MSSHLHSRIQPGHLKRENSQTGKNIHQVTGVHISGMRDQLRLHQKEAFSVLDVNTAVCLTGLCKAFLLGHPILRVNPL